MLGAMDGLPNLPPLVFLMVATLLEVSGDAVVRHALHHVPGPARLALFGLGAALLFGYGSVLNLAPIDFGRVVGLYIAVLFIVWQLINWIAFRSVPTLPVVCGGVLIIAGGAVVTYWKPA
jgi:small multidrug resistance family-3 protein